MLQGVANRDLKLENLLLTFKEGWARPLLKICDFGYSKVTPWHAFPRRAYVRMCCAQSH